MARKGLRARFAVAGSHEFEFDNFSTQTCNTKDKAARRGFSLLGISKALTCITRIRKSVAYSGQGCTENPPAPRHHGPDLHPTPTENQAAIINNALKHPGNGAICIEQTPGLAS
jgi:hypothetical protein